MGMKQLLKRLGEYLFDVIMRRHEVKSTIMTSNRLLEDWGKLISDVPSATAILDRFLHRSELFQINGNSYRLGNQEKVSKGANLLNPGILPPKSVHEWPLLKRTMTWGRKEGRRFSIPIKDRNLHAVSSSPALQGLHRDQHAWSRPVHRQRSSLNVFGER